MSTLIAIDEEAKYCELVRSYTIKDGHFFLSLMADGGTSEFEPIGRQPPTASKSPGARGGRRWGALGVQGRSQGLRARGAGAKMLCKLPNTSLFDMCL